MCLNISMFAQKQIADKDIEVYKMLHVIYDGIYETPYQDFRVELGKTYGSFLEKIWERQDFKNPRIEKGIHSFAELKHARLWSLWYTDRVIVKCVIPQGASYYKGTYNGYKAYASSELRYSNEVINVYNVEDLYV